MGWSKKGLLCGNLERDQNEARAKARYTSGWKKVPGRRKEEGQRLAVFKVE